MPRTTRYHAYKESPGHGSYGQKYCLVCGLTREEGNHQPPTDQIRARLDQMAAAEAANPSPVWEPAYHDDQPEQCPMCAATSFDFDPNHDDGISMGPAWLCTGCRWGVRSIVNPHIALQGAGPGEFTAEEIRLCHEATEFDHQCRVCTTVEARPDEARPGTDY